MIIRRVYDVLREAEDSDHIRISKKYGKLSNVIASGEWYYDCILELGDKEVISFEYDNTGDVAIWNILI